METIKGKMHAGVNGVYQDPEDPNIYYITHKNCNSPLLSPALSRYFILPEEVVRSLRAVGGKCEETKMYARYRGIWRECLKCGEENTCAVVYLKDSNVHGTHCLTDKTFAFGVSESHVFLRNVELIYIREQTMPSNPTKIIEEMFIEPKDRK